MVSVSGLVRRCSIYEMSPKVLTDPEVLLILRAMILSNVLLPTPLAPMTPMHSPGSAAKLMEFNNNRPEGSMYEMLLARIPEDAVMVVLLDMSWI